MNNTLVHKIKENKTEVVIHFVLLVLLFMVMEGGFGSTLDVIDMNTIRMNFLSLPLVFYFNTHFLIPRFLKTKRWFTFIFLVILTPPILEVVRTLLHILFLNDVDDNYPKDFVGILLGNSSLSGGVFLGFLLSFAYRFSKDWLVNLSLIEKLKTERSEMKLAFLKSQVDPHFLFNTLNSLYSIALDEKSNATADGIAKLGTLMRYNLHDSQAETISLNKEIEYIEKYVDLQRIRTTDKNTITFEIDIHERDLASKKIPPMLLIPTIENAFKHGISPIEKSEILISIHVKDNELALHVENTIVVKQDQSHTSGVGIKNLSERLELLYPGKNIFSYSNTEKTFKAHLMIELAS
ncbi:MAG: histidine kinase [Balneolaceae bacterium]